MSTRTERLTAFFETAAERQIIYAMKEAGCPRPWTQDSQFNTWYFCNVFRTQDKVTKWIITHVCEKYADDPDLWKKIIVARRLSRIESLEMIENVNGFEDLESGRKALHDMSRAGFPVLTNAFIMGIPDPSLGLNKIDYIYNLIQFYIDLGIMPKFAHDTVETCVDALRHAPNMGGFLSYEVATDFTYCKQYLKEAADLKSWAHPGPGCLRGLNYIEHGTTDVHVIKAGNAHSYMRNILRSWQVYWEFHSPELECSAIHRSRSYGIALQSMGAFDNLTMREVEHWLCEFDKHERQGRNKRTYPL